MERSFCLAFKPYLFLILCAISHLLNSTFTQRSILSKTSSISIDVAIFHRMMPIAAKARIIAVISPIMRWSNLEVSSN